MANQKTVKVQQAAAQAGEKTNAQALVVGDLIQATVTPDGAITVKEALVSLKLVDIADVDLLLTFANGDHVVIPNGALDALGSNPPDAVFSDKRIGLPELFKLVGVTNPAKAGSLRLVSDNIDADSPPADNVPQSEPQPDTPPPAPMVKVGVGTSTGAGKGPGNGVGAGEGEGDVPAAVVPLVTAQPAVYRVGKMTQSVQDLLNGNNFGQPNVHADLYTSSEFKVAPSGRVDLPLGAYDPAATTAQLADRSSPTGQSTREIIQGTAGADTIDFNPAFSSSAAQWSKSLHVTLNNFSDVTSIQLVFNAAKIALIPGFDLQGAGITRDTPTSNSWHITPTAAMLLSGVDVAIVYNVANGVTPVDFGADLTVNGHSGAFAFEIIENLSFTWRDVQTPAEFTVTSSTGAPLMVLPSGGVGMEVFAGNDNDIINAGAGQDLVHGEGGNDTLNGGRGNDVLDGGLGADVLNGELGIDTATYENSSSGVAATLDTTLGVINTNEAAGDTYASVENLMGSIYDDILIGNSIANTLTGGSGNDKLVGGADNDTLDGGAGTDTASYEYASSAVTVSLASNTGTAGEADGDVLVSIENLIGGAGGDTFVSALGAQANAYDGRGGIDTMSYAVSTSSVVAVLDSTLLLAPVVQTNDAAGDTFASMENIIGTNFDDTLYGNNSVNVLNGGTGDDILEGFGGGDTFTGGAGIDTVSYANSALDVVSSLTTLFTSGPAVTQTNDAFNDTYSSIENMIGSSQADTLIGGNLDNTINGGSGDDILEGMGGADSLIGGSGTDTASYAHAAGYVLASLTTGLAGFTSQGDASGDTYNGIENLTGSAFNDTLIGNNDANIIIGDTGDDILEGLGGGDTLNGGAGVNTASYEHGADQGAGLGVTASLSTPASNTGDAQNDTYINIQNLIGSAFSDTLTGDTGNNTLTGGAGNDTLTGGLGADILVGGDGNDILTDDLIGVAQLLGGNGDDILNFTTFDTATVDVIDGGAGIDTLVANTAVQGYWNFNMKASATQAAGTIQNSWGAVFASFNGVENITVTGNNYLYVYVSNGDNIITGGSTGSDYVDYAYALGGINADLATGVVTGGSGNDTLFNIEHLYAGSLYNDILTGNDSNNTIRGLSGNDVINGGNGIDTWYIDYTGARVTASLLSATQNTAMGIVMTGDASGDTVTNMENILSSYSDFLYGNAGANDLYGAGMLEGFLGADNLRAQSTITSYASYANAGNAYLAGQGVTSGLGVGVIASLTTSFSVGPAVTATGDAAGDTYDSNIRNMTGSAFNDTLFGQANNNILNGGAGDDVLEGMDGADALNGGAGIDTASYAHSNAGVTVDISGVVTGTNHAAGDTFSSIENITGSNFNDVLYGNSQDNILTGGLGNDTLDGGSGNDTASYLTASGAVNINLATNTVTGADGSDTLVSIERVIGSSYIDTITGSAGDDVIDGGLEADIINGGAGSDTISYANATGFRNVNLLTGVNTDNDTLSSIENIIGSSGGETLVGDNNDNVIEGGLGDDTLSGGANAAVGDTVSYASASAGVTVSLAVAVAQNTGVTGNDTLSGFENLLGSAFDDALTGDAGNNVIDGGSGNDILIGGAGADTLKGGLGIDTVSYAGSGAGVIVTINGAASGGDAAGDILTGIENLIGSAGNDTLTGDTSANTFDGGLGANTINGGAGIDTVTYANASGSMSINIFNGGVNATGGGRSDSLSGIENIIGTAFNDTIIGDGNANIFEGGAGADTMNGGGGNDTLTYASSNAGINMSLVIGATNTGGHAAGDVLTGSGFANIIGSAYDDTLRGNTAANSLNGGDGNDILIGGAGSDTLDGGLGLDTASYVGSTAVTVNLTSNNYRGVNQGVVYSGYGGAGDAAGDTYNGIENVTGSSFNDALMGTIGNNVIDGGAGNDLIYADSGNDIIYANQGFDVVYAENGNDTIYVSASSIGAAAQYNGGANDASANADGRDTIILQGLTNGGFTFATLANETDQMEGLNIKGDGISTIFSFTSLDIRNFVDAGNASNIWIKADSGDSIVFSSLAVGETKQETSVAGGVDYVIFDATNTQVAAIHWQTA
jgi:Ca2+-binding RTX toxin-like protein